MDTLTFFHAPQTRSSSVAVLLEELKAPHERRILDMKAGEQREAAYLAINPMGKVPAILHRGTLVTEQVAVFIYLADLFPAAGLTPGLDEADRGPFLRWLAFYGSSFEPAMVDKALQREPGRPGMMPYGSYDDVVKTLRAQLGAGPFIGGARMTAADLLWGPGLRWIVRFKLLPEFPEVMAYIDRIAARPSLAAVEAEDARLVAEHEAQAARAS